MHELRKLGIFTFTEKGIKIYKRKRKVKKERQKLETERELPMQEDKLH